MTGIRLAVEQEISMRAQGHQYRETLTLIDRDMPGVGANF